MRIVCNDGVTLELRETRTGLSQHFLSDRGDHVCSADPSGDLLIDIPGAGARSFAYTSAENGAATLTRPAFTVETRFSTALDAAGFDIVTRLTALAPLSVARMGPAYVLPSDAPTDYAWVPSLKRDPRDIAADHTFRSPALIARQGNSQVALVPHLSGRLGTGPLRAALDLRPPHFSYTLLSYRPYSHVYYRPTGVPAALQPADTLEIGYTLLFDAGADELSFQSVVRFLWRRYGERNLASSIAPQAMRFDQCARLSFQSTLDNYRLWRGFTLGGRECGGICARIVRPTLDEGSAPLPEDTTLSVAVNYLTTRTLSPRDKLRLVTSNGRRIHPHLWNAMFLNNVRTSFAMAYYARRWGDALLSAKARAIWNLALTAPAPHGIFPSVFTGDPRNPRWVNGTNVFRYTSAYHTIDAAVTGCWMLAIDRHLAPDTPFAGRCAGLAAFLLRAQLPSGAVPAWVHVRQDGAVAPVRALAESAGSAAAGMFLAGFAAATGREELLDAARRVARFIVERVFPAQEWYDTEVFYSCSRKPLGWRDPVSGIPPQGTLSMAWAAELFRLLFLATRDPLFLRYGRATLDLLLMYQQIWNAPFLGIDTRGGFGVMNTDAEWNDARQASFSHLLMDWYDVTGEQELFHRGVAALRAAFTLMHGTGVNRGAISENYGHAGRDAHIQGYVMPDWGGGTATSAAALAQIRRGDLYIDAGRGRAFGVNACRVTKAVFGEMAIALDIERLDAAPLLVRADGVNMPQCELRINGALIGRYDKQQLERGVSA